MGSENDAESTASKSKAKHKNKANEATDPSEGPDEKHHPLRKGKSSYLPQSGLRRDSNGVPINLLPGRSNSNFRLSQASEWFQSKDAPPLENLVFEGGGAKGIAYCGACLALERMGLLQGCKRFAGTSAGSITATLLACGYTAEELLQAMMDLDYKKCFEAWNTVDEDEEGSVGLTYEKATVNDYENLSFDRATGNLFKRSYRWLKRSYQFSKLAVGLIRQLWEEYGFDDGDCLLAEIGKLIEAKCGNPRVTFKELYDQTGRELCIVACNVNTMEIQYFHVKHTPDVPIRQAVRMSTSFPPFFQPWKQYACQNHRELDDRVDLYVDGGILCNYPIHVFDGWWLSMDPSDNILLRMQPISKAPELHSAENRFKRNQAEAKKTLGFKLLSEGEADYGATFGDLLDISESRPLDSKILKRYLSQRDPEKNVEFRRRLEMKAFLALLDKAVSLNPNSISEVKVEEMLHANKDQKKVCTPNEVKLTDDQVQAIFNEIDDNGNGCIELDEIVSFLKSPKSAFDFTELTCGYPRNDIKSFGSFISHLIEALQFNVQLITTKSEDRDRTVIIPTDYVGTLDLNLSDDDKKFLIYGGELSTEATLRERYAKFYSQYKNSKYYKEVKCPDWKAADDNKKDEKKKKDNENGPGTPRKGGGGCMAARPGKSPRSKKELENSVAEAEQNSQTKIAEESTQEKKSES